jgi:RNA polymerase sigma-70 factor (ECF subfamily)
MSDQSKTRISLILRLRHPEDAAAWQEFVEIYQPLVFRLARSRGLQEADALDMTQEVLARVAGAINRWNPDPQLGSFRGWISRITRNLVIQFLRSKNHRPLTSDDSSIDQLIQATPDPSPVTELFDLEHERQVFAWAAEKVRSSFQPKSWQAFWLTAVENRPADQVARELGLSRGAVYIARSRVMARLKDKVQNHARLIEAEAENMSITRPSVERNER